MSDVKSAKRVFEFLEYFSEVQRSVSVAEVANKFKYPNSSVSSILRTMVSLGYLSYDRSKRTYLPTARLPFLSTWIGTRLFEKENLQRIMEDLSAATGAAIMLATLNGRQCQYVHILPATSAVRLHTAPGFRPLARTAAGIALLSKLDDEYIKKLMRRIAADAPKETVKIPDLMAKISAVRRKGYSMSIGHMFAGGGAIAVPLPTTADSSPMVVAIGSVESLLIRHESEYAKLIKATIAKHFGRKADE